MEQQFVNHIMLSYVVGIEPIQFGSVESGVATAENNRPAVQFVISYTFPWQTFTDKQLIITTVTENWRLNNFTHKQFDMTCT